jgi:hypothetical protein
MAEYVILIYEDEKGWANAGEAVWAQATKDHNEFMDKHKDVLRPGSNALQPTSNATSVRKDSGGGFSITDAAFAETKEALGGFYVVDVPDLDAAIAVAKDVPAPFGGVEVRPVMIFD